MEIHDFLAGVAVLVGLVGIVVVILPGIALQVAAVAIWAFEESSLTAWVVLGLVVAVAIAATALKYVLPGRQLREVGIPRWMLTMAVAAGIVGFFAVPVVGAPLGFLLAVYLFERARVGSERAWPSTKAAVKAVMTSVGIELAGGFIILLTFTTGALLT